MPAAVMNELRLLSSDRFDSRSLLSIVFAGDARLSAKLGREELLPLGSRVRVRLPFEQADPKTIAETLVHLMTTAGNANLMTPELVRTIAEHAMGNHRVAVGTAAELLAAAERSEQDVLDEGFYLEVFGARGARRARRGPVSGRGAGHDELDDVEATARWLILDGAPALTGETAAAAMELLSSLIDAIEGEYAARDPRLPAATVASFRARAGPRGAVARRGRAPAGAGPGRRGLLLKRRWSGAVGTCANVHRRA